MIYGQQGQKEEKNGLYRRWQNAGGYVRPWRRKEKPPKKEGGNSFKEQFKTFTDAQKAMLLPMLAVLGIIAIAFLLVYIIL